VVAIRLKEIKSQDRLPEFTSAVKARIRSRLRQKIDELKAAIFGELPMSPETNRSIKAMALEMLTRHYFGPLKAGIVIAGFGEKDFMPSLLSYDIEEMVENRLRSVTAGSQSITPHNSAAIVAFAQQEMVHSFLQGIDRDLYQYIKKSTSTVFEGALDAILNVLQRADRTTARKINQVVRPELKKLTQGLAKEWDNKLMSYWGLWWRSYHPYQKMS